MSVEQLRASIRRTADEFRGGGHLSFDRLSDGKFSDGERQHLGSCKFCLKLANSLRPSEAKVEAFQREISERTAALRQVAAHERASAVDAPVLGGAESFSASRGYFPIAASLGAVALLGVAFFTFKGSLPIEGVHATVAEAKALKANVKGEAVVLETFAYDPGVPKFNVTVADSGQILVAFNNAVSGSLQPLALVSGEPAHPQPVFALLKNGRQLSIRSELSAKNSNRLLATYRVSKLNGKYVFEPVGVEAGDAGKLTSTDDASKAIP